MQLSIRYDIRGLKEISILGEVETKEEVNVLIAHIDDNSQGKIKIIFQDANIVNKEIIEKLHWLQEDNRSKVYVNKPYLYSYLHKLGILCKYVAKDQIKKGRIGYHASIYQNEYDLKKEEVGQFLMDIYNIYGYDYTKYQIDSIVRRIKISMIRQRAKNFQEFKNIALKDEAVFEQMFIDFSINTTEFFRDPEIYAEIKENILVYLNTFSHIRIWCAGCSTGEEPYSLAILLDEMNMLDRVQIYATDINPYVIQEAKNGLYSLSNIERYINNYKEAQGDKSFLDYFKLRGKFMEIDKRLKKNILFFQHSLIGSGILNEFQLILCRNVMIYLDSVLQKNILHNFYDSLDWNGFLILGKSEGILNNHGTDLFYSYQKKEKKIYRKKLLSKKFDTDGHLQA